MHDLRVQRTLITYIRRNRSNAYLIRRADLRREFAYLIAAQPNGPLRTYYGQIYRNRKAAMVITTARTISIRR